MRNEIKIHFVSHTIDGFQYALEMCVCCLLDCENAVHHLIKQMCMRILYADASLCH